MSRVNFISGAKVRSRILDTSRKSAKLDASVIEKSFNVRPAGSSAGLDLFVLREAMGKMLQSTGGRPALALNQAPRIKVASLGSARS